MKLKDFILKYIDFFPNDKVEIFAQIDNNKSVIYYYGTFSDLIFSKTKYEKEVLKLKVKYFSLEPHLKITVEVSKKELNTRE